MNLSLNIGRFLIKYRFSIDETYIFAKKTYYVGCMLRFIEKGSIVWELWYTEVDGNMLWVSRLNPYLGQFLDPQHVIYGSSRHDPCTLLGYIHIFIKLIFGRQH